MRQHQSVPAVEINSTTARTQGPSVAMVQKGTGQHRPQAGVYLERWAEILGCQVTETQFQLG